MAVLPELVAALLVCDSGDSIIVCADSLTHDEALAARIVAISRGCTPSIVLRTELDFILTVAA